MDKYSKLEEGLGNEYYETTGNLPVEWKGYSPDFVKFLIERIWILEERNNLHEWNHAPQ